MKLLKEYSRKRNFNSTQEPAPEKSIPGRSKALKPGETARFFIQRHDASRLHYDFRLEMDGVLKSWAVPKGPSLDPRQKRLAVMVEDHPLAYGTFEGNIPKGEYGGGSVLLWDRGTFTLLGDQDSRSQLHQGNLKFTMDGTKLQGEFALVRLKNEKADNQWLLIKKSDANAAPNWKIELHEKSVATGRKQSSIASSKLNPAKVKLPTRIEPMLAQLADNLPEGPDWVYEVKWDGVRTLAHLTNDGVELQSRSGGSYLKQFPELSGISKEIHSKDAILDGEIVALDEQGLSHFEWLQPRIGLRTSTMKELPANAHIAYCVFDLLFANGSDLRSLPLSARRKELEGIVKDTGRVRLSGQFTASAAEAIQAAGQLGLEGLIAKRLYSSYASGRSSAWRKVKIQSRQEFLICGWLPGKRKTFASLVLGVREGEGLRWCGNVGTGFDAATLKDLSKRLSDLKIKRIPSGDWPKEMHPVKPGLVCEVKFAQWTSGGKLRAPVYLGLRSDKAPDNVVKEDFSGQDLVEGTEQSKTLSLDGHAIPLTNLNKVYFPEDKITKRELLNYYAAVSPYLLPYLKDRPLSLRRYPDGIHGKTFFQKNLPDAAPTWVKTITLYSDDSKRDIRYCLCPDLATLMFLVNMGCIDHNPWMSRTQDLDSPDYLLIDLDANGVKFGKVVEAALAVKELLDEVSLGACVKTSGGDGIHLLIPLEAGQTYVRVKEVTDQLALVAQTRFPKLITIERAVAKRPAGRVYFDHVQVGKGKTIASPFSVRPYPKAPVSMPLLWSELDKLREPGQFHLRNCLERLTNQGDVWNWASVERYQLNGSQA